MIRNVNPLNSIFLKMIILSQNQAGLRLGLPGSNLCFPTVPPCFDLFGFGFPNFIEFFSTADLSPTTALGYFEIFLDFDFGFLLKLSTTPSGRLFSACLLYTSDAADE